MVIRLPSEALPIARLFEHVDGSRLAIIHGKKRWTFDRLEQEAARLSGWLAERGVGEGDFVSFALKNGPWFLALALAIYRCGAIPAPLSPKLTKQEQQEIVALLGPALCVAENDLEDARASNRTPVDVGAISPSWKACTSGGSTGRPKVIVDARPAAFPEGTEFIGIPANATVMVPGPLYHNAPFSCAVFALWCGSTVVTMERFDAQEALALIGKERVNWALMVPTMMSRILLLPETERAKYDLSAWSMVVHTAAPIAAWQKRQWIDWQGADHIWEVYGATEGLVRCWIGGSEWLERPGSVGRPVGDARLRILNESGEEVSCGEVGEVFAMPQGGAGSTYRYIGAERRADRDGWESVGDAGWVDEEGYLYLADRKDDLIISGGVNIWPAEVENAILRHPEVRSCAVYGVADADLGTRVHAVIETDAVITTALLSGFLDEHLSRTKHPRSIEVSRNRVRDDAGKFRKPRQESPDAAHA